MARAPFATWRPVPSATDPKIRPIGVILHVDAGNAYSLFDWWMSDASGGIESHFHVAKDGYVEQYRDTEQEADANYKGNSFIRNGERVGFISVETQGFFDGEWTPAQLARIRQILTWAHDTHGIPLIVAPSPYDPGVGYHVMWGAPGDWTPAVGKVCPGPKRIDQFYSEIVPWMEAQMKVPMPKWAEASVERLDDLGYFPAGVPTEETMVMWRLFVFLDRAEQSMWKRFTGHVTAAIAAHWKKTVAYVGTAIAAAGVGDAVDANEVIRSIGEILRGVGS